MVPGEISTSGSTRSIPRYYTVADGDGQTTAAREAGLDVGRDPTTCRGAPHIFHTRLNQILDEHDFDGYVEGLCQRFYADDGRPGLPPGATSGCLLIGYLEGLDAERAIAWRAADSFVRRECLGLVLPDAPPDHSTISRTRRLIDLETHEAVCTWMLQRLADAGLVKGKTVGIDATTLEANAAAQHRAARHRGERSRLPDKTGAGLGHRDADARGSGVDRSEAGLRVSVVGVLHGHADDRPGLEIDGMLGFVRQVLMRQLIGVGTPRGLQGRLSAVLAALLRYLAIERRSTGETRRAPLLPRAAHAAKRVRMRLGPDRVADFCTK